jgi:hypothetical protein
MRVPDDKRFILLHGGVVRLAIGWEEELDYADLLLTLVPSALRELRPGSSVFFYTRSRIFPIGSDMSALDDVDLQSLHA